jgi:peptidoglycan/xylan/chitin deacetylase (PgdA/CDA1 family)
MSWAAPALAPHIPQIADALRISRRCVGGLALTFDDGPHRLGTPAVLQSLARARATATFFVVGEQVQRRPSLLREIVAAGHDIAVHGFRHRCQLRLTARQTSEDLARAADLIGSTLGNAPTLHRPAYGIYSLPGLAEVRRRGWTPTLWSRWGQDWTRRATPASIATRATRRLGLGDVLLLHDSDAYGAAGSWTATANALPRILAAMDEALHRTNERPAAAASPGSDSNPLRPHRSIPPTGDDRSSPSPPISVFSRVPSGPSS